MRQRKKLTIALLVTVLVITIPPALTGGELAVSWKELFQLLTGGCCDETVKLIILELRLPRVILAILCGAALGISGAVLQSVLLNPLASPDLLGITAGGGCAALITLLFFPALLPVINVTVFAGAFLTALLALFFLLCTTIAKGASDDMTMKITWLALLILFGVGEAITVGLTSVWFAVGALGGLIWLCVRQFGKRSPRKREKQMRRICPSRQAMISKWDERAFTALMPTPFRPTDFLKASPSYLPPVLILAAHS